MGGAFGCSESGFRLRIRLGNLDQAGQPVGVLEWLNTSSSWMPEFRSSGPLSDGLIETNEMIGNTPASWPMDVRQKEHSMAMIIRLELPNTMPQSMQDIVGAFKMDEHGIEQCVGQAMPCATNEGLLYFLTAYGEADTPSGLTFRWTSGLSQSTSPMRASHSNLHHWKNLVGPDAPPPVNPKPKFLNWMEVACPNPFDQDRIHWHGGIPISLTIEDATAGRSNILTVIISNPVPSMERVDLRSGVYFIEPLRNADKVLCEYCNSPDSYLTFCSAYNMCSKQLCIVLRALLCVTVTILATRPTDNVQRLHGQ